MQDSEEDPQSNPILKALADNAEREFQGAMREFQNAIAIATAAFAGPGVSRRALLQLIADVVIADAPNDTKLWGEGSYARGEKLHEVRCDRARRYIAQTIKDLDRLSQIQK